MGEGAIAGSQENIIQRRDDTIRRGGGRLSINGQVHSMPIPAQAIDERVYRPEHPNVARDVNNPGSVLQELGELEAARGAFQRALEE